MVDIQIQMYKEDIVKGYFTKVELLNSTNKWWLYPIIKNIYPKL